MSLQKLLALIIIIIIVIVHIVHHSHKVSHNLERKAKEEKSHICIKV